MFSNSKNPVKELGFKESGSAILEEEIGFNHG